jgi:flagellar basal body-associated protein FliL
MILVIIIVTLIVAIIIYFTLYSTSNEDTDEQENTTYAPIIFVEENMTPLSQIINDDKNARPGDKQSIL